MSVKGWAVVVGIISAVVAVVMSMPIDIDPGIKIIVAYVAVMVHGSAGVAFGSSEKP